MTTIAEVRDQLATICGTVGSWRGAAYVQDSATLPVIEVQVAVFGQSKRVLPFRLTAYANRSVSVVSQRALDELAELSGPGSLIAAIQDGANWSVDVDTAQVVRVGSVGATTVAEVEVLARTFDVEVIW